MKNSIIISALAILLFASCKKEESLTPKQQTVTYHVECDYCLITFEDNTWNSSNEQERSKNQHLNVSGTWDYQFTNTKLDSLTFKIYTSVYGTKQKVRAMVFTNDGKQINVNETFDPNNFEKTYVLKLK